MDLHVSPPWKGRARGALLLTLLGMAGCGQPEVGSENRELLVSLVTAVSSHNPEWLEKNAHEIEERRQKGEMTDKEYERFQDIVKAGRDGRWSDAEASAYALREAQEPTSEDLRNLQERKLDHGVGRTVPGRTGAGRR